MARILSSHNREQGIVDEPAAEHFDANYARLTDCDVDTDVFLIEADEGAVGYGRSAHADVASGRDCIVFCPIEPEHRRRDLFVEVVRAEEAHLRPVAEAAPTARYRAYSRHPGPDEPADGIAAWLEELDYEATEWGASLVRPHLDDVPELPLPDGVEVRPVREDQLREIVAAHHECFRGEWDFTEIDESTYSWIIDDPWRDESLWQVAWAGDQVVGQVKPFVNHDQNTETGRLRGYTEYISTHHEWRNRGLAGALLARSLRVLRERGMTEAALGVDTNNPGGAFHLYRRLGFEPVHFEAVYTRPIA